MFPYATVLASMQRQPQQPGSSDIELDPLSSERKLGAGRAGDGSFVLVAPGQPRSRALTGRNFTFEPWTTLRDTRSGVLLEDVSLLMFRPVDPPPELERAVTVVFVGLLDLAAVMPASIGAAIQDMQGLFESGLMSTVSRATEIGLAGELLTIMSANDRSEMISMWHSASDAQFDFSRQGERLEVKTTTSLPRSHHFSSGQVSPIPGVCTTFLSLHLPLVETGSTVASLFADLSDVSDAQRARVRQIIMDTAHEPPETITSIVFDAAAAVASRALVFPDQIPTPMPEMGVISMRWEADLTHARSALHTSCGLSTVLGVEYVGHIP